MRAFLENGGSMSPASRTFQVSHPTVRAARDGAYARQHDLSFMFVGNGKETEVTQLPHDRAKTHDEILADSRNLQDQAIDLLEKGNVREAAEISWGATKRATDGAGPGDNRHRTDHSFPDF